MANHEWLLEGWPWWYLLWWNLGRPSLFLILYFFLNKKGIQIYKQFIHTFANMGDEEYFTGNISLWTIWLSYVSGYECSTCLITLVYVGNNIHWCLNLKSCFELTVGDSFLRGLTQFLGPLLQKFSTLKGTLVLIEYLMSAEIQQVEKWSRPV